MGRVARESLSRLRAGTAVRVGGVRIVPVERVAIHAEWRRGFLDGVATRDPLAVVCRVGDAVQAFGVDGQSLPVDDLLIDVDGLREALG